MILRVALIAAVVGAAVGLLHVMSGQLASGRISVARQEIPPIQGDLLYRLATYLDTHPLWFESSIGVSAEALRQEAIAHYEVLALPPEAENVPALLRLGIIYSKQGYPEQGRKLLQRLVVLDNEYSEYYFSVANVYAPEALSEQRLEQIGKVLSEGDGWLNQMVLHDYYRRAGQQERARRLRARMHDRNGAFSLAVGTLAIIYAGLALTGVWIVLRFVCVKLFRPAVRHIVNRPWREDWSTGDALMVAVAAFVGMLLAGPLIGLIVDSLELRSTAPRFVPLVCIASYLVTLSPALGLILWKMRSSGRGLRRALGLDRRPDWGMVRYAVGAYGIPLGIIALGYALLGVGHRYVTHLAGQSPAQLIWEADTWGELAGYFVLVCLIAPVVEEIIFRGVIYAGLRSSFNMFSALILSAGLFAFPHMQYGLTALLGAGVVGILLGYMYEQRRTLWPSIFTHFLHNVLVFSAIWAVTL